MFLFQFSECLRSTTIFTRVLATNLLATDVYSNARRPLANVYLLESNYLSQNGYGRNSMGISTIDKLLYLFNCKTGLGRAMEETERPVVDD